MLVALAIWCAILLFSPPESNFVWAVNGFRSISLPGRFALLATAAALWAIASIRSRALLIWGALAPILAWALAYPLRERIHFLGDSAYRIHALFTFGERPSVSLAEMFRDLHAPPLDVGVNFLAPIALHRAGLGVTESVSLLSMALGVLYLAGVWRLAGRLAREPRLRPPIALVLALTGALEAFAGYAESTGLILALAPWWWAELLRPITSWRVAVRISAAWCITILAHRVSLVLLLPMLWRALGPELEGDRPPGRRALLVGTIVTLVLAFAILRLTVGPAQMGADIADAFSRLHGESGVGILPPFDIANLIALVAPLAFLAPAVAGMSALKSWLRSPEAKLVLVAALPLVPLAMVLPAGPHGFGAHRDWDLAVLCGWTLTLGGVGVVIAGPPARARGALRLLVPVLAVGAGAWVAVNADEPASVKRALALASRPPLPAPPHLGVLHQYLGQRSMDLGQFELAGGYFERAYGFSPNPRYLLLAAEARLMNGEITGARGDVVRARASRRLNARGMQSARQLDEMIEQAAHDSAAAPP
jgi:hypothetical protein